MTRFEASALQPLPPEIHHEIGHARMRALELAAGDRELHFDYDDRGRVLARVRTLDGCVLRTISAIQALAIIDGADPDATFGYEG